MKKKVLSILTPILATDEVIKLLPETITSVTSQTIPKNWEIEWIVVEDGKKPKLTKYQWPEVVRYRAVNKFVYESCARTLALCMAKGSHVLTLDADDSLPKNAIKKICRAYEKHPKAMWVAGQEATPKLKNPWISRFDPRDRLPIGYCKAGLFYPFWLRTRQFAVTFQCSYKTKVLWEIGGYPSIPYISDTNLLLGVSSIYPGVILKDIVLNYRRWPGQMTAQKAHATNRDLANIFIDRWVKAIQKKEKK